MASETIKEFLVALGFDVDENSYSKFETRLGKATSGALELGSVITATAVAVEVAVAKMSRQFEDLFYMSQRTRSSISSLQSFENAARTIGVSSDQARSAVEGLSHAMRTSPGITALLNQLGVRTRGRGSVEILGDLIGQLKKMPHYLATQYGQMFGIDEGTLFALENHYEEFRKAQADYAQRQKESGVDTEALSVKSRTFMNTLRELSNTLELIGTRFTDNWIEPMTNGLKLLDDFGRKFIELDKSMNGWATTLATIGTTALSAWIAKLLLARLLFRGAATEAASAVSGGAVGSIMGEGAGGMFSRFMGFLGRWTLGPLGMLLGMTESTAGPDKDSAAYNKKLRAAESSKRAEQAVQYFVSQGWTREQATGLASNIQSESGFNERSRGDSGKAYGIAQWHPDRQANFKRVFGKDIRDSTFEEQLQFMQYELTLGAEKAAGAAIKRTGSAAAAGAAVSKFYERPQDREGQALARGYQAQKWYDASVGASPSSGGGGVTINTKTDIHVSSTDPKQAAREVANKQEAVAATSARYAGETSR